jgi:hypothetical protein
MHQQVGHRVFDATLRRGFFVDEMRQDLACEEQPVDGSLILGQHQVGSTCGHDLATPDAARAVVPHGLEQVERFLLASVPNRASLHEQLLGPRCPGILLQPRIRAAS